MTIVALRLAEKTVERGVCQSLTVLGNYLNEALLFFFFFFSSSSFFFLVNKIISRDHRLV
jgi:hypothetical protein